MAGKFDLLARFSRFLLFLGCASALVLLNFQDPKRSFLEFSGLHYCLFVKVPVVLKINWIIFFDFGSKLASSNLLQKQLWYLITSVFVCQDFFYLFFRTLFAVLFLADNEIEYSITKSDCQYLFHIFLQVFLFHFFPLYLVVFISFKHKYKYMRIYTNSSGQASQKANWL